MIIYIFGCEIISPNQKTMIEERSKKEIFRHENNYKRMCRIHKYVNDLTSFDEGLSYFHRMKKHSSKRFKEITAKLREESKKRKEKKEQKKKQEVLSNLDEKQ